MQGLGFILIGIASTMMNSENLTIPMIIATLGILLTWRGNHAR